MIYFTHTHNRIGENCARIRIVIIIIVKWVEQCAARVVYLFTIQLYTAARCYNNNIYKRVQYNNIKLYNAIINDFTS